MTTATPAATPARLRPGTSPRPARSAAARWAAAAAALALGVSELIAGAPAGRHLARRRDRPGRHRPPATGRQGFRGRPVRDERQARPRGRRRPRGPGSSAPGSGVLARRSFALAAAGFAASASSGSSRRSAIRWPTPAIVAVQAADRRRAGASRRCPGSWRRLAVAPRPRPDATAAMTDPARRSFLLRTGARRPRRARGRHRRPRRCSTRRVGADRRGRPIPPASRGRRAAGPGRRPRPADRRPDADRHAQRRSSTGSTRRCSSPSVDIATWTLRIHGLVERETTLTWDELAGPADVRAVRDDRVRQQRGRRRTSSATPSGPASGCATCSTSPGVQSSARPSSSAARSTAGRRACRRPGSWTRRASR